MALRSSALPVRVDHPVDKQRLGPHSAVGEYRVPAGHLERRHVIGAQRHRGRGLNIVIEAQLPRHLHHAAVTDHLGNLHRRHVERIRQRFARRHRAVKIFAIIVGRVLLAVEIKRGRLVLDASSPE